MNRHLIVFLFTILCAVSSYGQTTNYAVAPITYELFPTLVNPAYSLATPGKKWSLSLLQVGGTATSSTASVSFSNLLGWNAGYLRKNILGTQDKSNGLGLVDIRGPMFNYAFNEKINITVATRTRFHANYWQADGRLISEIGEVEKVPQSYPYIISNSDMTLTAAAFSELSVASSFEAYRGSRSSLRLGGSVKFLNGLAQSTIEIASLSGEIERINSYLTGITNATGSISTFTAGELFSDLTIQNSFGIQKLTPAVDFGFMYEVYRESSRERMLSLGISITDIGVLAFKPDTALSKDYNISISPREALFFNNNFNNSNFSRTADVFDKYPELFDLKNVHAKRRNLRLPTTLHINLRYQLDRKFAVQLDSDLSLTQRKRANSLYNYSAFAITPIYSLRNTSFAVPVAVSEYTGLTIGLQVTNRRFTIGSRNIVSSIFHAGRLMDLYVGIRI